MLEEPLERILAWHKQHGRKVVDLLQPGLTSDVIAGLQAPLMLRPETVGLYMWRNGTRLSQDYILNDHYFTPGYYLLSLEDSLHAYQGLIEDTEWPEYCLPFLASGGGDYYGADNANEGHVFHYIRGNPDLPVKYLSLTAMMESAAECYESGAYYADHQGFLQIGIEAERRIARRFNPGLDYRESA